MDYCLWTSSCVVLHSHQPKSLVEDHVCCFTCKEKSKCAYACVDRNKGKKCSFQRTAEEVTETWAPKTFTLADTPKTSGRRKEEKVPEEVLKARKEAKRAARKAQTLSAEAAKAEPALEPKKSSSKSAPKKATSKSSSVKKPATKQPEKPKAKKIKSLWEVPKHIPTTVKELADQTGATYARASYLIKTKKLSYEEALKILQN